MEYHFLFNASFFAAFAMGLFSSLHCIGMCGSIIGTLTLSLKPEIRNNKSTLFPYVLNYNIGRIFSYTLAGLLVGFAESLLTLPFGAEHGHRVLQLLSAMIMVGAGLYIAGWFPRFAYIEKAGSGTQAMIRHCRDAGLPEPDFELRQNSFVITIWRDWLTEEVLTSFDLNDRQVHAVAYLKAQGRITNQEYQDLTGVNSRTALRDLRQLMDFGLIEKVGQTGRGTHYLLRKKPDINPTNPT